tara:strand:+ start:326 stop:628 length:303 start_codon:yes stop_codon:yes gene_type:complete
MTSKYCRVWPNNTGVGRDMSGERIIRFGLKGSSDIIGVYKGLFLGIEVKTGNAVQNKDQINFQKMIESCGGIYILCKNNVEHIDILVEQAYKAITKKDQL